MRLWHVLTVLGPMVFSACWDVHHYLRDRNIARRDGLKEVPFDWQCFYAHLGMGTGGGGTLLGILQSVMDALGRH